MPGSVSGGITRGSCELDGFRVGSDSICLFTSFNVIANYQLEFELGLSARRPVAQEYPFFILVTDRRMGGSLRFERNTDIVLQTVTDSELNLDEFAPDDSSTWIEAKSLGRASLGAPQWTVAAGKTSRHRQFALDCSVYVYPPNKQNSGFNWWLQNWNPIPGGSKTQPPLKKPHMETLNKKLHIVPRNSDPREFGALGVNGSICSNEDAKLFTIGNILVESLTATLQPEVIEIVHSNLPKAPDS